jgi:hypothetical protein|nr:MAG TPA: hypothetical protein [Bacteriophage sp.]
MQDKCSKCDSEKLFVEIQGNRRGLYCGKCGKWQKWITKQELQILGKYEIEERAKEVLQEIIKSYRYYRTAECDGYTNVLQETAVFEMPED